MLLTTKQVAEMLSLSPVSMACAAFRTRIGLPVVKIGKAVRIKEEDVWRLIAKGQQHLPTMGK